MRARQRGMVIRGQWRPIQAVIDHYVCRKCQARIGKPYADPVSGELDFERMVCANEHEIIQEGDIISTGAVLKREMREIVEKIEVLQNYGHKTMDYKTLYVDKNFDGFG